LAAELPQTLSPALPPGTLLQEYSLLSVLGMGGFGITYLAADNNLHLKVAIKEFFPSSAVVRNQFSGAVALKSEQAQAEYSWGKDRFMREAQTLARFRHKNIVQVFRYFEGNGSCYMVMAYEEGQSLEDALEADPARWDTQAVLALMMPLLDGLESVHAAGFLHRDIKPANIVLRASDGSPVLIDFGAARAPTSSDAHDGRHQPRLRSARAVFPPGQAGPMDRHLCAGRRALPDRHGLRSAHVAASHTTRRHHSRDLLWRRPLRAAVPQGDRPGTECG
jgi:serine/threonine protein kinase